ncbi:Bestrophin, RFP-TM, chloride channel-domain-containing protein [Flagelloscypha sp. PMI_526]|nr:Bestrophin, RFP-TM, chloride channel-domain-containing protein [Flagelloscypha sp. PMI_526]
MPNPPNLSRSLSGSQLLLPAVRPGISMDYLHEIPRISVSQWTFGHGSVIYTIWPAVLVQTLFATAVVVLSMETRYTLRIPSVMLNVLGLVIGFVISYRAISGYERYWMGRSVWTEIIKNARSTSRLIHIHVPARLTPKTEEEIRTGEVRRSTGELVKAMGEKRLALDLIAGFCYALKHHIRGELGIYYDDLYHLVKPLHDHGDDDELAEGTSSAVYNSPSTSTPRMPPKKPTSSVPTEYGSVQAGNGKHRDRRVDHTETDESQPLLPPDVPAEETGLKQAQANLVPFGLGTMFNKIASFFKFGHDTQPDTKATVKTGRRWQGPLQPKIGRKKGAPRETGTGENLPLEIIRCLSEWCSVLEDRGTVPGSSLGSIIGNLSVFEGSLTSLEMILGTPLPFAYAAHIRHTVWIYLFFLPFQLIDDFGYYTILGVAIASFIYLGFVAAGDEIEQPFGYDENDLDLDLFCREIISDEIEVLKRSPGLNSYLPKANPSHLGPRRSMTLVDLSEWERSQEYAEGTIEGSTMGTLAE